MYKTNVNRSKTRKWVEAKVQSYDGDDWGADYDEPDVSPIPPPPSNRPAGPRQAPGLPLSSQLQPVESPVVLPGGLTTPSGTPTLHIQTQPPPTLVAAAPARLGQPDPDSPWQVHPTAQRSSAASVPATDQPSSPQSGKVPQSAATASGVYSGGPTQGHASPALQSVGPETSRFPPRKSSMSSQQDTPDLTEMMRQQPGSVSQDVSQKPRTEPRSASPASNKSPKSPNKPLPFIRPADIYRRMEEEKEKERKSTESGRPSLDSIGGRGSGAPSSLGSPSRQQTRQSHEETTGSHSILRASQGSGEGNKTLTPVTERRSEYGLEGLLASYGPEKYTADSASAELTEAQPQQPQSALDDRPSMQFEEGPSFQPEQDPRRFSTSPKLPDLARMSGFGDNFFSDTSPSFMPDTERLPTISDEATKSPSATGTPISLDQSARASMESGTMEATVIAPQLPKQATPAAGGDYAQVSAAVMETSNISGTDTERDLKVEGPTPPVAQRDHTEPVAANLSQQQPVLSDLSRPAFAPEEQEPPAAEVPHPEANQNPEAAQRPLPEEASTKTATVPAPAGMEGAASALQSGESLAPVNSQSTVERPLTHGTESSDVESETADEHESVVNSVEVPADAPMAGVESLSVVSPNLAIDPPTGPPGVRNGSSTTVFPRMADSHIPSEINDSRAGSPTARSPEEHQPTTSVPPLSAIAPSEITPTAPLNPRKDARDLGLPSEDLVTPSSLERTLTIDTSASSPVKESDMLREEIIKSLSPVPASPRQRFKDYLGSSDGTDSPRAADDEPVRESAYLGDVYGDYWAANEDPPGRPEPIASRTPPSEQETIPHEASTPRARKRFSWEVVAEDAIKPEAPSTADLGNDEPDTSKTNRVSAAEMEEAPDNDAPQPVPFANKVDNALPARDGPGAVSHRVSLVSTIPPRPGSAVPIEPPSPVSVLSESNAAAPENHRLSFAEEKVPAAASTSPTPPSPPQDQHPGPDNFKSEEVGTAKGSVGSMAPQPVSILPFRQILDMPSTAERIRMYNETRQQFATMDTGLGSWLADLKAKHPEHGGATSSFQASVASLTGDATAAGQIDSQPGSQQPLYQQYPNASSLGNAGQGGRPTSNMPMPPSHLHGPSGFGHTGNQVGAKSKEFFMAAGKAGKGLLSKGKNKLRNTGDKVFS